MRRSTVVSLFHLLLFCVLSEQKFSITGCQKETAYDVLDNNQSSLTCTGLHALSNIYWSFTGPSSNGTEIKLGECYACNTNCSLNNCKGFDTDFVISRRNTSFTTLRFVSNVERSHGGLIKCSQFDNQRNSQAYCAVRKDNTSPEFHIPECSSGLLQLSENQSVSLTCTGLWPVSNTYWSITDIDAEVSLGNCSLCYHNCSSKPCEVADRRYNITRSRFDVTTLEFLPDIQDNGNATVKCSQLYNETTVQAKCAIMILQGNTTPITVTQTTTNDTSLVAGGAGAATLVVICIIVVVVVVRRSKRKKGPTGSEENSHTSGTGEYFPSSSSR
ncbi:uncharacterized protein [Littorina saxatilis]|uniref:uncharacterized protein n=1 Tax=Littorina saxatilis TaxID=31220 RepID=UPI0038B5EF36